VNIQSIRPQNVTASAVWNSGGQAYEEISATLADSVDHCILRLNPQRGERVLDIATGTGWSARQIAARGAIATGIDFGVDLIEAAKAAAAASRLDIDFRVGDAEALSFEDQVFDVVVSTFGVMFVREPEAAAAEIGRVCRKGGRIGLTTWAPNGTVFDLFKVMRPYMPPPPASPPQSPFAWGNRDRVQELLEGMFDLRFETGTTVLRTHSSEAVWDLFVRGYGPTKSLADSLAPERRESLKRDFISYYDDFKTELGVAWPRDYLLIIGVRK
jgi:SAM-dependent methyltransferase